MQNTEGGSLVEESGENGGSRQKPPQPGLSTASLQPGIRSDAEEPLSQRMHGPPSDRIAGMTARRRGRPVESLRRRRPGGATSPPSPPAAPRFRFVKQAERQTDRAPEKVLPRRKTVGPQQGMSICAPLPAAAGDSGQACYRLSRQTGEGAVRACPQHFPDLYRAARDVLPGRMTDHGRRTVREDAALGGGRRVPELCLHPIYTEGQQGHPESPDE